MSQSHKSLGYMLLEILIALAIIALSAGVLGTHIGRGVEKWRFQEVGEGIAWELHSAHRLAFNTQADWILRIEKKKGILTLRRFCPETGQSIHRQWKITCGLLWNRQPIEIFQAQFSSTGKIDPRGIFEMTSPRGETVQWTLPEIFAVVEESDKACPRPARTAEILR